MDKGGRKKSFKRAPRASQPAARSEVTRGRPSEPSAPRGRLEKAKQPRPLLSEIGVLGLKVTGGIVREEFLPQLQGPKAMRVYQEMADNDPTVGAILFVIEQLLRSVAWKVVPGGRSRLDGQAAEFLSSCLEDTSHSFADFISEVLSMLPFGWAYFEIVYKIRKGPGAKPPSKFDDGLVGWRKLALRAQTTLRRWEFDSEGGLVGMVQQTPKGEVLIPIEKALLFRTTSRRGSPEGRSILRSAYRPWWFKKRIEELEGIGIERDLVGFPVLKVPDATFNSKDEKARKALQTAEWIVMNARRDEQEGLVLPQSWEFELLRTGGQRQFDTNEIIQRYDQRIAQTVLADIVLMGQAKVGSYALAEVKKDLFYIALTAWLDSIQEVFNRFAIPRLFELNPRFAGANLPKLIHEPLEPPDLKDVGRFITLLARAGAELFPDDDLENYLRELAKLPPKRIKQLKAEVLQPTKEEAELEEALLKLGDNGHGRPSI